MCGAPLPAFDCAFFSRKQSFEGIFLTVHSRYIQKRDFASDSRFEYFRRKRHSTIRSISDSNMGRVTSLLLLLSLWEVVGLVVNAPSLRAVSQPRSHQRSTPPFMKSQEDKEFEEWARQKKIKSGIDPDEDFGAGRRAERTIFAGGGAPKSATPFPTSPSRSFVTTAPLVFSQGPSPSWCRSSLQSGLTTQAT